MIVVPKYFRRLSAFIALIPVTTGSYGGEPMGRSGWIADKMCRQLRELDRRTVQVLNSRAGEAIETEIESIYRAEPKAKYIDGNRTILAAAANAAIAAVQVAVNSDPANPRVQWFSPYEHDWSDFKMPSARYGLDNPDNFYLRFPVDPQFKYRINGIMPDIPARDISISVQNGYFWDTDSVKTIDMISGEDIELNADRTFSIRLSSDVDEVSPNTLKLNKEAGLVMIRQTIGNWETEAPAQLYVEKIPADAHLNRRSRFDATDDQITATARRHGANLSRVMGIEFPKKIYEKLAVNTMTPVVSSGALGGLTTQMNSGGSFSLGDDEALIITTKTFGARYVSLQLADVWMVSREYVRKTGNLNNSQTIPNEDGTITFVISVSDPGVYNWADPDGIHRGYIALRYQGLPANAPWNEPLLDTRVVKLADLREALPEETRFVTPAQRREQIAKRIAGYQRREAAIQCGPVQ